ncbi:hypothetical protein E2P81_ATG03689 [Venturia nashicola]|nr:hypothetical protein E2P81_ATG03689 [Venturia nashicola]
MSESRENLAYYLALGYFASPKEPAYQSCWLVDAVFQKAYASDDLGAILPAAGCCVESLSIIEYSMSAKSSRPWSSILMILFVCLELSFGEKQASFEIPQFALHIQEFTICQPQGHRTQLAREFVQIIVHRSSPILHAFSRSSVEICPKNSFLRPQTQQILRSLVQELWLT